MRRLGHHYRDRAFTLIELLVVIGIIAVLVTLVTFGVRSMVAGQKESSTRISMENLKNLITEKQVSGGVQQIDAVFGPPPPAPLPVVIAPRSFSKEYGATSDRIPQWSAATPPVPQNATAATQAVIALLRAVPNNAKFMSGLPAEQLWLPPSGPRIPLFLDAWGNPILYVPPGGMTEVSVTGGDSNAKSRFADTNPATPQVSVQSPDLKGFWASAGPDGLFTDPDTTKAADQREPFGDDNVYSFESK